jgi:hypothetical protein
MSKDSGYIDGVNPGTKDQTAADIAPPKGRSDLVVLLEAQAEAGVRDGG